LEDIVDARTKALQKTNKQLLEEINEREQAEREKQDLEEKLARSQKMEALGLLAGGVAHDLNNVLSGIVSYPDLLLMDLDEKSPLRKPILTIQDSGQKAAAIVQDLLTLARRGVTNTKVLNMNNVVYDYLNSPECKRLKSFHPNVMIEKNLKKGLLNVYGSQVHLRKTVMNLVSNAAEAQPLGGSILIYTENRYLDNPVRGYDDVHEGEYVVLGVKDHGIGIDSEDLKRIFEPFYTKKVMGRSGTGLGMAVVWGTVQDHEGYIDVISKKGEGTLVELYFPITRKAIEGAQIAVPIDHYTGNGERIVVVDDVPEQREIAMNMLQRLNYKVKTVASGEEAVEYFKKGKADLMVLDMIMDPGMDGLETYQEVVKIRPGQRAIIASGFAENERVREVQRMGAGEYIKKPYTLEGIGAAVKRTLNND
jgi:signal transduction histidine kinase